jgi:hypothetical protein
VHVGREMDYGAALARPDVAHLRAVYARDQARVAELTGLSYG